MNRHYILLCCALTTTALLLAGCTAPQATVPAATDVPTTVVETATAEPMVETEQAPTETEEINGDTEGVYLPCNLAFQTDRDGNLEIYVMGPDGSNQTNLTQNPAYDIDPAWSADGSQIAFASNRETEFGGQYLYLMNADGSDLRQLTFYEPNSSNPDWSPDGQLITFTSEGDIYIIKADGSNPEAIDLTNTPDVEETNSSWSPDGSMLAWLVGSDGNRQIVIMEMDGGAITTITDSGNVHNVEWTVDGRLFAHWENNQYDCFNCVLNPDGTNVIDAGGKGTIQEYLPFWTLDGDRVEVAYIEGPNGDNEIVLVGEIFPDIFLYLTNDPGEDTNPDWPANCGLH
ncbi:MAG: PD40 domain-containing protein [Anaerolineaceae bacterium]|nr:PD40 domain-containing protein [Anaerolineaceae bacterium]